MERNFEGFARCVKEINRKLLGCETHCYPDMLYHNPRVVGSSASSATSNFIGLAEKSSQPPKTASNQLATVMI